MSKEFKIGGIIHFMKNNEPQTKTVKGIVRIEGEVKTVQSYSEFNNKENDPNKIILTFGDYDTIDSEKCFATLKGLQNSVFGEEPVKAEFAK